MPQTVLVIDDERDLLDLIAHHLKAAGFDVLTATRGSEGARLAAEKRPDLILLDIMLPDVQGTDVLRKLRQEAATAAIPVIFLTARGEEVDRVVGFELGAEDYVVKPFSPRELTLRVKALLRRATPDEHDDAKVVQRGGIRLDRGRHEVRVGDEALELTPTEFNLLAFFMDRPGRVLDREALLNNVWGADVFVTDRTVDTHVKRLRSKLGAGADAIETVRGVGYRFRA
jgi:two-component system phosphate regulon response regulator PhoB